MFLGKLRREEYTTAGAHFTKPHTNITSGTSRKSFERCYTTASSFSNLDIVKECTEARKKRRDDNNLFIFLRHWWVDGYHILTWVEHEQPSERNLEKEIKFGLNSLDSSSPDRTRVKRSRVIKRHFEVDFHGSFSQIVSSFFRLICLNSLLRLHEEKTY